MIKEIEDEINCLGFHNDIDSFLLKSNDKSAILFYKRKKPSYNYKGGEKMGERSKGEVAVIKKRKIFRDSLRINPFKKSVDGKILSQLILYGILGLILVRIGLWKSPPVDTFYYAFAFGLYLDLRVELRELRKELGEKK
ncbi:MAG: hypothetical protein QMD22_02020 [archaeon]|nr:hypothetical protein [archaeon]